MKTFIYLIALLCAAPLRAEALSWAQALSQAAQASPELAQARERLEQAQEAHAASLSLFMPSLNASAGLNQGGALNDSEPAFGGGGDARWSLGLGASQNLFRGFADLARWQSTRASLDGALEDWRSTWTGFTGRLRQAYARLDYARLALELAQDILKRRTDDRDLVELRYEAGFENKGALLQAQAQHAQAEADVAAKGREQSQASLELGLMLGQDPQPGLLVEALGPPQALSPTAKPDFGKLALGLPAALKAKHELERARADAGQNASSFWPQVGASAGLSRQGSGTQANAQGSWSLGLSASWDLFSGGADLASLRAARSRLRQAEQAFLQAKRQGLVSLAQAWSDYLGALERLGSSRLAREAAETRAEIGRAKYTQGLLSFDNWDQIENDAIVSRSSALQAELGVARAWAAWLSASGEEWRP